MLNSLKKDRIFKNVTTGCRAVIIGTFYSFDDRLIVRYQKEMATPPEQTAAGELTNEGREINSKPAVIFLKTYIPVN